MMFSDGTKPVQMVENPRGVQPRLSDADIMEKWRLGAAILLTEDRSDKIKNDMMTIENLATLADLLEELSKRTVLC